MFGLLLSPSLDSLLMLVSLFCLLPNFIVVLLKMKNKQKGTNKGTASCHAQTRHGLQSRQYNLAK
jgi:hypothetical protein